ncbi:MAG: hypothetical protein K2Q18_00085 [Bdellovibrionales bacterium]|nr:hypothetical protein [Bdellovibrionales bacterium]
MANPKINNILIPNVTSIPTNKNAENVNKLKSGETSEFKGLLDSKLDNFGEGQIQPKVERGIHLSTHALKRLQERNLTLDKEEYTKLQEEKPEKKKQEINRHEP